MPFETIAFWQQRIANSNSGHTWIVSELDGIVVGHGTFFTQEMPRLAHTGEIVMCIDDGFVRRGIGTAILTALLDVADNWRGLKRVDLKVYVDNQPAIRLYERLGFLKEGRLAKSAFRDGEYVDTFVMARLRL